MLNESVTPWQGIERCKYLLTGNEKCVREKEIVLQNPKLLPSAEIGPKTNPSVANPENISAAQVCTGAIMLHHKALNSNTGRMKQVLQTVLCKTSVAYGNSIAISNPVLRSLPRSTITTAVFGFVNKGGKRRRRFYSQSQVKCTGNRGRSVFK